MSKAYLLFWGSLFGVCAFAQESFLIRGEVLDDRNGEPLIGVNILIKGTSSGTVTDVNGQFSLSVHHDTLTLQISYTGYLSQELTLSLPQKEPLQIKLVYDSENQIAYFRHYAPPAVRPGGESAPGYYPHPGLALRGQHPGLLVSQAGNDPWAEPQLRAIGIHTLLQNAQPLWDIDGLVGAEPLLYDGMNLHSITHLRRPVDLLPYGLQAGSGVVRAVTEEPNNHSGWTHHYRSLLTYASPQDLPPVASAEAYRRRWSGRADLGFSTNWLEAVTRHSWSHDHHWQSRFAQNDWQIQADLNYRNAQGVGRNSQWQQAGGQVLLRKSLYEDQLALQVQAIANRRWGQRDYHQTFFQAAKYNPTAPIRFTERPQGNVFLEGMYEFSQRYLNNYFELISSVDLFNPVALQNENSLRESRTNQAAQAKLNLKFVPQGWLEIHIARQANDQIAGEKNGVYAYFRGNATRSRPGAAGRWSWKRRQELLQIQVGHDWQLSNSKWRVLSNYRFQRFRFGNENTWGRGFADNDFTYENFASRLVDPSLLFQYQSAETHRLIDFLTQADYTNYHGLQWRTAVLYQGSTRLGADHRWGPLAATDIDLKVGKLLGLSKLYNLHFQAGYGLVGGLPQNEEAYRGQYNLGSELPQRNNEDLRPEQRRIAEVGMVW
ncbi:MAG: hypothetical protein D6772_12330, partial [Bacteroidetes bacterium]